MVAMFFLFAWYVVSIIQMFMGFGTAYRLTKNGGDNGVALWGWLFVMGLVAAIPGLGIYLWIKYKELDVPKNSRLTRDLRQNPSLPNHPQNPLDF